MTKRVAIVGAGLRGLASAAYLSSMGLQVRVFEKEKQIGGVWQMVHEEARVNTPSHGYSFHTSNQWRSIRPSRNEILANLDRMIKSANLKDYIELSAPVDQVTKNQNGTWAVNGRAEQYDGVLVCTGFLGDPKLPPPNLVSEFQGTIRCAYDIEAQSLKDRNVVIVGSGRSALDMLALAHDSHCKRATLYAHPDVIIRDIGSLGVISNSIYSNPLLYKITRKVRGDKREASRFGIQKIMDSPRVEVIRNGISRVSDNEVWSAENQRVKADTIVWCTGWNSPTPDWVAAHDKDPTMLLAACKRCLDTAGFGYGTATVHAKALLATLEYGLTQRFASGTPYCNCDQEHDSTARHIILNLVLFYLAQPSRWKLLGRGLSQGAKSNVQRMRSLDEPVWVSLMAFLNAPFGF
jgi:pyridine nucleotide-disulfide oxidoreductase